MAIVLYPTVFHPKIYLTTDTLFAYLNNQDISNQSMLELGCGSGVISLLLGKKYPGKVLASDINVEACRGLRKNAEGLGIDLKVYESDLLASIPSQDIDTIIVNPPYFNKEVGEVDEYAFYTGSNYEYFHRLLEQLENIDFDSVIMILTDQCDLKHILHLIDSAPFQYDLVHQSSIYREQHYIYKIKKDKL